MQEHQVPEGAIRSVRTPRRGRRQYEYIVHEPKRRRGAKSLFRTYARIIFTDHYNIYLIITLARLECIVTPKRRGSTNCLKNWLLIHFKQLLLHPSRYAANLNVKGTRFFSPSLSIYVHVHMYIVIRYIDDHLALLSSSIFKWLYYSEQVPSPRRKLRGRSLPIIFKTTLEIILSWIHRKEWMGVQIMIVPIVIL